jgi:hypothetical protein
MKLTPHEERLVSRLSRYPHTFAMHVSAAIILMTGGLLTLWKGVSNMATTDIWLGAIVIGVAAIWGERLWHDRRYRELIGKLMRESGSAEVHVFQIISNKTENNESRAA